MITALALDFNGRSRWNAKQVHAAMLKTLSGVAISRA